MTFVAVPDMWLVRGFTGRYGGVVDLGPGTLAELPAFEAALPMLVWVPGHDTPMLALRVLTHPMHPPAAEVVRRDVDVIRAALMRGCPPPVF